MPRATLVHVFFIFSSSFLPFFAVFEMSLVETERHSSVNTAHCRVIKLESNPALFSLVTHNGTVPPCVAIDHKPVDFHLAHFMLSALAFGIMYHMFWTPGKRSDKQSCQKINTMQWRNSSNVTSYFIGCLTEVYDPCFFFYTVNSCSYSSIERCV